ncbi:MAG: bifunctional helix-turn-helix domain-containing protein/methylated-DNA--[protein]-cysteine S-methyltransferase [Pseudomonadota bacterium]
MKQDPYHYQIIARAIEFIERSHTEQPSLDDIASAIGLSPAHFQRVFTAWAGVSPKRYQQYLSLNLAKTLLAERYSLLETAHEVGLSGPSRLHDMFLTWEAMTPGDFAKAGADLNIAYGYVDTPYGEMLIMWTPRGICGLGFTDVKGRDWTYQDLVKRWPKAKYFEDQDKARVFADTLLAGKEARLHLMGQPFQLKVWEALLAIPSGEVTTYSTIAEHIGNPKAVRAVGTAVGRNPISWLVPCHRVLRKSGGLGGYHWGLPVKRTILMREALRKDVANAQNTAA